MDAWVQASRLLKLQRRDSASQLVPPFAFDKLGGYLVITSLDFVEDGITEAAHAGV